MKVKLHREMITLLMGLCVTGLIFASSCVDTRAQKLSTLQKDVQVVKQRLYESLIPSNPDVKGAKVHMDSLQADGSWKDVFYVEDSPPTLFLPVGHLVRLVNMAQVYRTAGHDLSGNKGLKDKISSALTFWLQKDFKSKNWWWNQIDTPRKIGEVLLLMGDGLSADQIKAGINIMKRSVWTEWTGQNLVWGVSIQIVRGCLENFPEVVAEAFDRMYQEIRIAKPGEEGIQADYSFYQHGPLLYSGGYGKGFSYDCARFVHFARGTRFECPKEKFQILAAYLLDGQQWMIRGGVFDYGTVGREITRFLGKNAAFLSSACDQLAEIPNPRQAEFNAFARRLRGTQTEKDTLSGNRHFWKANLMAHHRKDYYTSVRMSSSRLRNTESINNEGKKSHHLADGVTYIMRTGEEYIDIFPVWDWERVPGITAEQTNLQGKNININGEKNFVGGVSDSMYGMAAMDFARGGLTAKKSWFYFDKEFVCLGAGITCPTDNSVLTSINQCRLKGDVFISDGKTQKSVTKGERSFESILWVHHDLVGYLFPEKVILHLKNEAQTGSWSDIGAGPTEKVSLDVFSLWLDHGKKISGKTYSYIVVPGITLQDLETYTKDTRIEILRNTPQLQAVQHKGLKMVQVAFWEAGKLTIEGELSIAVDKPCLLLLQEKKDGVQLTVSNPENLPLIVNIEINRKVDGEGGQWLKDKKSLINFELPSGEYAGKSVIRLLKSVSNSGN